MARIWSDKEKERQRALIHSWQPWASATGPRTAKGKAVSSQNVLVGNANRAKALALAMEELRTVQVKIRKLSKGRQGFM